MHDNGTATIDHFDHATAPVIIVDQELAAMQTITQALEDLDDQTRGRVLAWVNGRWPTGTNQPRRR